MRIELLEETNSTNDYIRRYLPGGENVIVCARRQSEGRGTKGRSFLSREGGVYLSALTFYENFPAAEAFRIMTHAAVAVCRTAEAFGASPEIKWPNDVFVRGKKLAGILIENVLAGERIAASIVGIGMNVTNDLDGLERAIGLFALSPSATADEVRRTLIDRLCDKSDLADYLSFVKFLGKEIEVCEGELFYPAVARAILGDGRLEIETAEGIRRLSAAEITLKWKSDEVIV